MKILRLIHISMIVLLAAALLPVTEVATARPLTQEIDREMSYVPGEVVVYFPGGLSNKAYTARASALAGSVGAMVAHQSGRLALLSFSPEADIEALAGEIEAGGQVAHAQPNYVKWIPEKQGEILGQGIYTNGYTLSSPNGRSASLTWEQVSKLRTVRKVGGSNKAVPTFPNELTAGSNWGWDAVQADLIWSDTKSPGAICLLDTGVDTAHRDLRGRIQGGGYDFVNFDATPNDDNGHGTHVAGIMSALLNNGVGTALGVSVSRVLPVKVLNAQGYGTTYSVAAGIYRCADNNAVRVINMSLGSYNADDKAEYFALDYAINTKGKLVVAAAGNESTSAKLYPAAWGIESTDGFDENGNPSPGINNLYQGLISVAAGRSPSQYRLWVDVDHSQDIDADTELFYTEQCAASFSNYGSWVEMIAPGENIYSTTPTSYPFYANVYEGVPAGYGYMSGTSMATAFVSGAAMRTWSTLSTLELKSVGDGGNPDAYSYVHDYLIQNGSDDPDLIEFSTIEGYLNFDPAKGYKQDSKFPNTFVYGEVVTAPDSLEPDLKEDVIYAPFCWPDATAPFGLPQDTSAALYLNVAAAMGRGALVVEVNDAATGLPLPNAFVQAYQINPDNGRKVLRDTIRFTANDSPQAVLINLPIDFPGFDYGLSDYELRVNRSGYTNGYQIFNTVELDYSENNGLPFFANGNSIGLPPRNNHVQLVLDWHNPPETDPLDLDLYLFLPKYQDIPDAYRDPSKGANVRPFIAPGPEEGVLSLGGNFDFKGIGYLLDPVRFNVPGLALFSPYAIHNFNGGATVGESAVANAPVESVTIRAGAAVKTTPFRATFFPAGTYSAAVYSPIPESLNPQDPSFVSPALRVWTAGRLVNTYSLTNESVNCIDNHDWWHALNITAGSTQYTWDRCGSGESFLNTMYP